MGPFFVSFICFFLILPAGIDVFAPISPQHTHHFVHNSNKHTHYTQHILCFLVSIHITSVFLLDILEPQEEFHILVL